MKRVIQPEITQKELNKISKYYADVAQSGYRAWNTIRQSGTFGQGQEVLSRLSDRTHHLYSRGERCNFVLVESLPNVIDLKEQFPLPINETLALAVELNIRHPGVYKERDEHGGIVPAKTMTSDLVATFELPSGEHAHKVYSFKYSKALDYSINPHSASRTWKKLELERVYWQRQGIQWVLVTEQCFNKTYIYNLEYLRTCFQHPELLDVSADFEQLFIQTFWGCFKSKPLLTLRQLLEIVAADLNIPLYQAHALFQKTAYFKQLKIDLYQQIELYRPLGNDLAEVKYVA